MQTVIKDGKKIRQMSVREYAELLGISPQAVTKKIRSGKTPPGVEIVEFGRFYLVELKEDE